MEAVDISDRWEQQKPEQGITECLLTGRGVPQGPVIDPLLSHVYILFLVAAPQNVSSFIPTVWGENVFKAHL